MSEKNESNKRIAKNTALLYVRMFFSMAISLYTSRVVLSTLGVEDFGIYGVVGGIVTLFDFLNASMSGCTSRFLTFELGRGDRKNLHDTFSTAMFVHIAIAVAVLLIAEPVGIWFMHAKMQVPSDRMDAAQIVFHLSVLSMMINVTQVPYNASIISHERMDVYAYVEMANVGLKLLIVYLLQIGNFDKLVLYAVLVFLVSAFIALFYRVYCVRNFSECHVHRVWRPDVFKKMLAFSGWDLYGNLSVTMRTQGVNMLLNMFFGPIMNAAASIATQVQGAVMAFAQNVTTAVRPQIIKRYAAGEVNSMVSLVRNAVKLNFLVILLITTPLITELHYVLNLWLGQVPPNAVVFCSFTLLFNFFANLSFLLVTGIHATGKLFRPSLINGSLYLLVVPISYISFRLGGAAWTSYLFNVLAVFIGMLSNAYTLKLYIKEFKFDNFLFRDLLPCLSLMIIVFALSFSIGYVMEEGLLRLLTVCFVSTITISFVGYMFILPKSIQRKIVEKINSKIRWEKEI